MFNGEEAAVLFVGSLGGDAGGREILLQPAEAVQIVGADARDAEPKRELLAGARLIAR